LSIDLSDHFVDTYGFVSDVMTAPVVTLTPNTSMMDALHLLNQSDLSGIPVVDEYGRCVGTVSEEDVKWFQAVLNRGSPEDMAALYYYKVRDAMRAPAVTIKESAHIAFAAGTMLMHKLRCLPVVDDNNVVIGIVTRADTFQPVRSLFSRGDPLYRTMPNTESPYYGLCFTGYYA
jgi:CBS domain-containing protein